MSELFDSYRDSYATVVQSSIDFSGLPHDFFLRAKADLLRDVVAASLPGCDRPNMLDVGCGVGAFHPFLRNVAGRLSGIDISADSIARARLDNPDADYEAFDGQRFPFDDACFDLATAICVLHHVAPERWRSFVQEMRRVVRPGGLVCIIEHNPFNPLTRLAVSRCEFDRDAVLLRAGRTRQMLLDAGLCEIEARYFLLFPSAVPVARRVESALRHVPLGAQYAIWGRA
ncbi:MAG: hypothetical protein OJF62_000854 [Pseudolabrys sp.]|nr:hypothetical protein [Pseudolabrys sp.]